MVALTADELSQTQAKLAGTNTETPHSSADKEAKE